MKHTELQKTAIHTDAETVLVSAAAGSGKTSVLAERIARLVQNGADIRNMLVVTFTNAAAAEMRRRIAKALYAAAEANPDEGKRLAGQAELCGAADISTFHSFCARVVRENYGAADVLPDFRILPDTERHALKYQTLREMFDLLYEKQDADFLRLLARHTARANDARLAEVVLRVYDTMLGQPEPYAWALQSANADEAAYIAQLRAEYETIQVERLEDAAALMARVCEISAEYGGKQYENDCGTVGALSDIVAFARQNGAEAARQANMAFRIPPVTRGLEPACKERMEKPRSDARKALKTFFDDDTLADFEGTASEQLRHTRQDAVSLVELIRLFDRMYAVKKNARNALDYEDLQHKALAVLCQNGGQYADKYRYVFVDEYQDTNPVQEAVIAAVCAGESHLFMVGDIKQSIYKFRLADPGIFRRKAQEYGSGGAGEVIFMNDNFRSAGSVIDAVNFVMRRVMSEQLGEVEYGTGEELVGKREGGEAKILLCGGEPAPEAEEEPTAEIASNADTAQAEMIAAHMQGLFGQPVRDKETGEERELRWGDIAVLMRARSALTAELRRALVSRGIPCAVSMPLGRDIPEAELFVNLLRLIENPLRDIPLLSVLRSFIVGMDENDFAKIRLFKSEKNTPFYEAAAAYAEAGEGELAQKLRAFYAELKNWREKMHAMPLMDCVRAVSERYGFEQYFASARGGVEKKELFARLLIVMGEIAEAGGNSLFALLAALSELKKRDGCYAQAGAEEGADCVRVMTIHGAKGLEFPVVYVAGLDRRFNIRDANEDFLTHPGCGVTASYVDEQTETKQETVERAVLRDKILRENRSEELRMLYVAMTRARERLYLTGCTGGPRKQTEKWNALAGRFQSASSMLDWIMAANREEGIRVETLRPTPAERQDQAFDFAAYKARLRAEFPQEELLSIAPAPRIPAKVSVSAVKRAQGGDIRSFLAPEVEEGGEITGAQLGTLVHGLMERIVRRGGKLEKVAAELLERRIITEEEHGALLQNRAMPLGFLQSGLYRRIQESPRVLFEQPFNLRIPAAELGYEAEGRMLVQGILDLAFMENGAWVLLDYKTDRVDADAVGAAAEGYRVQLDLYARALERITGIPVTHRYLYFLRPQKEIEV